MEQQNVGESITVVANGQPRSIPAGSTVADLLRQLNITTNYVVVQLNGEIVPRSDFAQVTLHEQNMLEIVTLVGGG
ncbi:MAG: sulfur carrier protein ThiS [Ktedonobacteraceae bacterium]|nr:sulfur carrier protein ThiS [Ktedonobacteraceae bacterium]